MSSSRRGSRFWSWLPTQWMEMTPRSPFALLTLLLLIYLWILSNFKCDSFSDFRHKYDGHYEERRAPSTSNTGTITPTGGYSRPISHESAASGTSLTHSEFTKPRFLKGGSANGVAIKADSIESLNRTRETRERRRTIIDSMEPHGSTVDRFGAWLIGRYHYSATGFDVPICLVNLWDVASATD